MKIVVLGGTGVFGERLVELLIRDAHDVTIAARGIEAARKRAEQLGAQAIFCDRTKDISPLFAQGAKVIIDAAGPFQAYQGDPYALARACIENGVHYLDISDDAAFCAGIAQLDAAAKAANVVVLSGVSSVPALSSTVVGEIAQGMQIDTIDSAILPGNRAPRGRSVVASIMGQAGETRHITTAGQSREMRAWSNPRTYDLPNRISRAAWQIEVPDQRLFPAFFEARTVTFRAGLELAVMNWGLAVFSWLRARLGFGVSGWMVSLVLWLAKALWLFGSDRGGMVVEVAGERDNAPRLARWALLAQSGDGPFIPAVPARALCRDFDRLSTGARPCLNETTLDAMKGAMSDLDVTFEQSERALTPLFETVLGGAFDRLPAAVRESHHTIGTTYLRGTSKVIRGPSLFARIIAFVFRFPKAGEGKLVEVIKTRIPSGETWERRFDGQVFRSYLARTDQNMSERFGPFTFDLDLHEKDGGLFFPVRAGRIGPLPLPKAMLPRSEAVEREVAGRFQFDVALYAPITRALVVRYQGWLDRL